MKQITWETVQVWKAENKEFHLLDVREPWEHEAGHIGGQLIPLGELISRRDEIPSTNHPIVVYCKKGIRSQIAIQRLSSILPKADFRNLEGGLYFINKNY